MIITIVTEHMRRGWALFGVVKFHVVAQPRQAYAQRLLTVLLTGHMIPKLLFCNNLDPQIVLNTVQGESGNGGTAAARLPVSGVLMLLGKKIKIRLQNFKYIYWYIIVTYMEVLLFRFGETNKLHRSYRPPTSSRFGNLCGGNITDSLTMSIQNNPCFAVLRLHISMYHKET